VSGKDKEILRERVVRFVLDQCEADVVVAAVAKAAAQRDRGLGLGAMEGLLAGVRVDRCEGSRVEALRDRATFALR
jgi:hypothetical protein